jgi:hypothetical protein
MVRVFGFRDMGRPYLLPNRPKKRSVLVANAAHLASPTFGRVSRASLPLGFVIRGFPVSCLAFVSRPVTADGDNQADGSYQRHTKNGGHKQARAGFEAQPAKNREEGRATGRQAE